MDLPAVTMMSFNPRLREGGDHNRPVMRKLDKCFNPRLREGGD